MLKSIRQTFFKIGLFIRAIRAGIVGVALVLAGWIFLAPPSQTELSSMALPANADASDPMLRAHRIAKVMAAIDSDRLYTFVATRAETGQTATQIRDNVEFAADGFGGFGPGQDQSPGTDETQKAFVGRGGAKFVPARTN